MSPRLPENILRIQVPIPGPMESVNTYLIEGNDGHLLVDTGWDTEEGWESLHDQLAEADIEAEDVRKVLVTHSHADHMGLADQFREWNGATVMAHPYDKVVNTPMYNVLERRLPYLQSWLEYQGVPGSQIEEIREGTATEYPRSETDRLQIDNKVGPDTTLTVGNTDWEVIWTPGHSPGHICIYHADAGILLSGDHVLPNETPNISYTPGLPVEPLTAYLDSLERTRELDPQMGVPAHGPLIPDVQARIDEIVAHHDRRLDEIEAAIEDEAKTAWEVAQEITWSYGDFNEFGMDNQNLALVETLSHLEHLRVSTDVVVDYDSTVIRYWAE
jgi:glyoxylase-like metal-dependent hydrolase (beta-lactamase superfamily II)